MLMAPAPLAGDGDMVSAVFWVLSSVVAVPFGPLFALGSEAPLGSTGDRLRLRCCYGGNSPSAPILPQPHPAVVFSKLVAGRARRPRRTSSLVVGTFPDLLCCLSGEAPSVPLDLGFLCGFSDESGLIRWAWYFIFLLGDGRAMAATAAMPGPPRYYKEYTSKGDAEIRVPPSPPPPTPTLRTVVASLSALRAT